MGICCMTQGIQTKADNNLEEWDGEEGRKYVQEGGHKCIPMADSC